MATAGFPALMIRPPESPLQQVGGVLALQHGIQQEQLGDIQLKEAQLNQQSQQTLMDLFAKNQGDYNQTYADAAASGKVTPAQLLNFRTASVAAQTQAALLTKDQLENQQKLYTIAANELESVRNLPPEQQAQGIKDSVGRILQAPGADSTTAKWLLPIAQDLANNPSPTNFKNKETLLMGPQWVSENALKNLELASKPTAEQAQAKTQAELSTAEDEARMKHVEMLSQPTPQFAATVREANLRKTQAETAEAQAKTAKERADTVLEGMKPVIGQNPTTKQYEIIPLTQAKAGSYLNQEEASPADRQKYGQIGAQLSGVQAAVSQYKHAEQNPNLQKDDKQDRAMASILSDTGILGTLAKNFPVAGSVGDVVETLRKAQRWESLDDAHQQLLATYMTAKVSSIAFQKITTGVGRLPAEGMHLEFETVPSPTQAGNSSFKAQMDQYQSKIDVASTQVVKVPGIATPGEVRQAIESQRTPLQPIPGAQPRATVSPNPNRAPTMEEIGKGIAAEAGQQP